MNALRAPLTALAARREECCYFLLDNADVVIEEILRRGLRLRTTMPAIAGMALEAPAFRHGA